MKDIPLQERVIFALDVDSPQRAKEWVRRLESHIRFYKVGLQLFLADGFAIVDWIAARGHKVMLDLKLFDVPATVRLAVEQLSRRNVAYATVHGNDPIVRAAVQARGDVRILAVTVLTSFGQEDMREMGFTGEVADLVYIRAKRALSLGCDGIVSSGLEASRIRSELGEGFLVVTPGIRPGRNTEIEGDDQRRIATAGQAIRDGADQVVVGRPIREAKDPLRVVEALQEEIRASGR
jgi:orotidine-5'-phosphate decarboxylase